MTSLNQMIRQTLAENGKILSIYLPAGYPHLDATQPLLSTLVEAGADMIELGIPFSDPLADGPTIQAATQKALAAGTTVEKSLNLLQNFKKNYTTPVLLMGYANPFLQFGWERLLDRAATAGASGFIIPDLPPEESLSLQSDMSAHGMDLIYLVAPNTGEERIAWIDRISQGFVYAVSVTGVTGARDHLAPEVIRYLELLKSKLRHPVLVGFGVSGPEAAVRLAAHCNGVIIGSAVIQCIEKARDLHQAREQVFAFVSGIRQALNSMKRK